MSLKKKSTNQGFTLIEITIAMALFLLISYSVYLGFSNTLEAIIRNEVRFDALSVLKNEIEKVKDMRFEDIGITGGYPPGILPAEKTVTSSTNLFTLKTFVRNIDDPHDGTTPADLAPADYKLVEFEISCPNCPHPFPPVNMTTSIASQSGLENLTNNGSLFINVFDAHGKAVANTNVTVSNSSTTPPITITDTTNNDGMLQLVDIPTSTAAYSISVTKTGYSSDRTYQPGDAQNPNPLKPHSTVAQQTVTAVSFTIDQLSTLNITSQNSSCSPVNDVQFRINGTKLIGSNPNVLKHSSVYTTDINGQRTINNLEWDTYSFINLDPAIDISATIPIMPLILDPATTTNMTVVFASKNPNSLLVSVTDENNNPVSDAVVTLIHSSTTIDIATTSRKTSKDTDWSAGQFSAINGEIDLISNPGYARLVNNGGLYTTSTDNWFESRTLDAGSGNASFLNFSWSPANQPPSTGPGSLTFQIATNNDNSTWNFTGPDGTGNTFFTQSATSIPNGSNKRYLRYKAFLKTADENQTPSLEDVNIEYSTPCAGFGQVFFSGLAAGTYTVQIQKQGFQTNNNEAVTVLNDWNEYKAVLSRE